MLDLIDIQAKYGKKAVLRGVSLKIAQSSLVCLLGPVSAGKSTIAKLIVGLIKPIKGQLLLNDYSLLTLRTDQIIRMGIALVPEGRRLFPEMTVIENLLVSSAIPEARQKRKDNLDRVFRMFPILTSKRDQLCRTLSGGEQQMVAIARAVMSSPKLMITDEPSLGLAPIVMKEIFQTLLRLRQKGLTVLLIEQNVYHALNICDFGYVLENGKIAISGSKDQLLENQNINNLYLGL